MNIAYGLIFTATLTLTTACDRGSTAREESGATPNSSTALTTTSITVDGSGYRPGSVNAAAGKPARLVFTRTSDDGCGQQLVFPAQNIRKDLPLNQPVVVDITMPASGNVEFTCGMNMWRGSIVAQ